MVFSIHNNYTSVSYESLFHQLFIIGHNLRKLCQLNYSSLFFILLKVKPLIQSLCFIVVVYVERIYSELIDKGWHYKLRRHSESCLTTST